MKNCIYQKSFQKWGVGGMYSLSLILPSGSAPGHKLEKPSKEPSVFQAFGTINFVFFYKKSKIKRGGMAQCLPPHKYVPD